ncbi:GntR family transcriptional regulator [Paraglaciecola chathamensis]|uniref:GntR family transcriptional regulator n=1 Tax=Paraglaciecola chathamensis TaxID=368405 RepID=UPI0026FA9EC4|nr:GntR family transcriptional regulator [Paraglaciecola chathamensis]MDO6842031.1 GntR family transcriptional regulator [Paraglaciecola chathamensis]
MSEQVSETSLGMQILLQGEQSIYNRILADIATGKLISGDRLVTKYLATCYQTSINPVREALKQLEGEGFVTFQKNSGARVAAFEYATMREVFEILQLLEPYFLSWYAKHCSAESLARLDAIQAQLKSLDVNDSAGLRDLDTAFHWEMYRHHYNASALRLWKNKKLILQALHGDLPVCQERFNATLKEHDHILYLLNAGDDESAVRALTKHVVSGGDYWSSVITEQLSELSA